MIMPNLFFGALNRQLRAVLSPTPLAEDAFRSSKPSLLLSL